MSRSWNQSVFWRGKGEREGARTPPRAGQLLPCQQQEVTWCVVALGAPGPPARCLEIAHLGLEGLEDQEGEPAAVRGAPPAPSLGHE